ncbi:MAG: hypothetical protein QME41_03830 [Actinomycetota bacterium]|nr:hypothetical protein [Actinomycetota bacterium]
MSARIKQASMFALVCLIVAGLALGAYAATGSGAKAEGKLTKNPKQSVGKNWGDRPGSIKPNGTPKPKKNLFNKADAAAVEPGDAKLKADAAAPVGPDQERD